MCENREILLRENKSKDTILPARERFRCQCLTSGRFSCFGFFGLHEWSI